jgi:hypothetical protein
MGLTIQNCAEKKMEKSTAPDWKAREGLQITWGLGG